MFPQTTFSHRRLSFQYLVLCTDDHLQETSPLYFMFSMNYFNLSVGRVNLHIGRSTSVFRPSLRKPSSLIWSKRQNHSSKVHNESWKRRGFYSFSTRGLSNAFYTVKMSGWVTSGPAILLLLTGIVLQRQRQFLLGVPILTRRTGPEG